MEVIIKLLDEADQKLREAIKKTEHEIGNALKQEKLTEARKQIQEAITNLLLIWR